MIRVRFIKFSGMSKQVGNAIKYITKGGKRNLIRFNTYRTFFTTSNHPFENISVRATRKLHFLGSP